MKILSRENKKLPAEIFLSLVDLIDKASYMSNKDWYWEGIVCPYLSEEKRDFAFFISVYNIIFVILKLNSDVNFILLYRCIVFMVLQIVNYILKVS